MNAGVQTGFATVIGGVGGYVLGLFVAGGLKESERRGLVAAAAGIGSLAGAFIGGSLVAPGTLQQTAAANAPRRLPSASAQYPAPALPSPSAAPASATAASSTA